MKLLSSCLFGLALIAAACGEKPAPAAETPPPAAAAGPALWKTGDADTTIYLLGTVHVLPPSIVWRTPQIDKALGEAKVIYFETDTHPNLNEVSALINTIGMYPVSERLSSRLKPDDRTALAAAAEKLDYPMANLDRLRPWLAANEIAQAVISRAGYETNSGVEIRLAPDARADGKEIRKLETVSEQLTTFADLPEDVQIAYLMDNVRQVDEATSPLDEMVNAWAKGDVAQLEKIMVQQDLDDIPEIYNALLVKRNANWVKQLDTLIKTESGTFFVAVGAAHLIGKDSVLAMLEPMGHPVTRIE